MAQYRPGLGVLPAGFSGSGSGLSALDQPGTQPRDTAAKATSAAVAGAYLPQVAAPATVPVNPYAGGTPPRPVGDAAGSNSDAASAHPSKAVPPPYQPPALAVCTFTAAAGVGSLQPSTAAAVTPPHLTPTKSTGAAATPPPVRSPMPGYNLHPPTAVHASSPASIIPGLALLSASAQRAPMAELASSGSGGGGRLSQNGLSTVGLPPALVAAKAVAATACGSGGGSRPISAHPSRGPSSDGMAQILPHAATGPTASATTGQAGGYNPLLMAMSAGAAAATTSRSSTPPLPQQPMPAAATTTTAADSLNSSTLSPSLQQQQQQQPGLPAPASLPAPIQVPVATAPVPVRPVVSAAAPGARLPTPVVVGRLPQPVLAAAAPVPIITSTATSQPPQAGGSSGTGAEGDAASARRQLAIQLAEMMGDNVDVATCLDVLEQVNGDESRAAAALLELCGGGGVAGGGGGAASSGRLPGMAPPAVASAAEEMAFSAGVFDTGAKAGGFFAAADGFGAAAAGPGGDGHFADEGFLGMAAGFGEAAGGRADTANAGTATPAFDFASLAGGSPPSGQGAEHMRAALEAAGLSCDDEGLAQLYQQQEEIEEQRRRERLQQQIAMDEAKVRELQQQQEARAAREREQRERVDAQAAAAAMEQVSLGSEQDAGAAWGTSGTSGAAATQATGCFGAAEADDTDAFFLGPDEEGAEKKHETMKIYFGKVYDEDALRFCLEACHGDVDMALEVLGEQYVEAREKEQQEADEKYARALQQQHSSGGAVLEAVGDSLLEDYMINAAEGLADVAEAQRRLEERQQAETASRRGRLGSDAEGRNRLGLNVLRRQFPDAYNDGVVADALSSHGGDVEAARAALLTMGYREALPAAAPTAPAAPVPPPQRRHPTPPQQQQQRRSGVVPAAAGAGAGGRYSDEEGDGAALVSHRGQAQQWRLEGGGLPGNAAVLGNAGASNNAAAQRAAQLAQLAAAFPRGDAAAALAAAAVGTSQGQAQGDGDYDEEEGEGGGAGPSTSSGAPGSRPLGPIKALASLGLNFDELNVSDELREMVRFAFKESGLPEVFRQQAEAESAAQYSGAGGRRMGSGLTHEEKQVIWATNRNLPKALHDMAARLRRGGRQAYEAGDRRLAGEMKQASQAVERLEREAHERAASRIYTQMNNSLQQQWSTDLHGLRPHEALKQLEEQLHKLSIMGGHVNWTIITGKGLHSDQALGPVLPATVADWLERKQLQALTAPGHYVVRLNPEVFARLAAEAAGGGPAAVASGGGAGGGPAGVSG